MRFILQNSKAHPHGWVCTDTENRLVCEFENGKFNETQRLQFLDGDRLVFDRLSVNDIARISREMGEWLTDNYPNVVFPCVILQGGGVHFLSNAYWADIRRKKGLTIDQLAEASGVSRSTIVRLEQGRGTTTLENVEKIARALGYPDDV